VKQNWILANFPKTKLLFAGVQQLGSLSGLAFDVITLQKHVVPTVDLFLAGFVCKSVSRENNLRQAHAVCITNGSGLTGETFSGVMSYIRLHGPRLVVCENVEGLCQRIGGQKPPIRAVLQQLKVAGYSCDYRVIDSRCFLLPQRRRRVWLWALMNGSQSRASEVIPRTLQRLSSEQHWSLDVLLAGRPAVPTTVLPTPNERQLRVIQEVTARLPRSSVGKDVLVDIAKSAERAAFCLDAAPCLTGNSLMWRSSTGRVLCGTEAMALLGLFEDDVPDMRRLSATASGLRLLRDMAGNAFATTVCLGVLFACIAHAPRNWSAWPARW
jgi:hypothetical protein